MNPTRRRPSRIAAGRKDRIRTKLTVVAGLATALASGVRAEVGVDTGVATAVYGNHVFRSTRLGLVGPFTDGSATDHITDSRSVTGYIWDYFQTDAGIRHGEVDFDFEPGGSGWTASLSGEVGIHEGGAVKGWNHGLVVTARSYELEPGLTFGRSVDWWFPSDQADPGANHFRLVLSFGFASSRSY